MGKFSTSCPAWQSCSSTITCPKHSLSSPRTHIVTIARMYMRTHTHVFQPGALSVQQSSQPEHPQSPPPSTRQALPQTPSHDSESIFSSHAPISSHRLTRARSHVLTQTHHHSHALILTLLLSQLRISQGLSSFSHLTLELSNDSFKFFHTPHHTFLFPPEVFLRCLEGLFDGQCPL